MLARSQCTCGLRDKLDEANETIRQLEEMLAPGGPNFPAEWRLTESERRILAAFIARTDGYLSHDTIMAIAIKFRSRRGCHYAGVIIFKLRRKMESLDGIEFINRPGYGYQLTKASRELIRKALAAEAIVEAVKQQFAPA
jgi:DNA-binding response OmpR family regulator